MTYQSEVLADTPRLYWRMGESSGTVAVDSSGNGRSGTYSGVPTFGQTGLITDSDTAVLFDGTVRITYADTADLTAFTFEAWYKGSDSNGTIAGRDDLSPSSNRIGWVIINGSKPQVVVVGGGGSPIAAVTGPTNINDNTRHHLVGTYDGTTTRLYVDGVSVGTPDTTVSGALSTQDVAFTVGGRTSAELAGVVDEVAYYTTALSAARIAAHYTAGTATPPKTGTGTGAYAWAGTAVGVRPAPPTTVKQLATGLPMKISSAGTWIPVKALT